MKALTFTLHLETPLLATQPNAGEPNSAVSYDFIPGSMIRGALVRAYQQINRSQDLSSPQDRGHKLFFSGEVCYLNAYPALPTSGQNERMLPKPLSWFVEKEMAREDNAVISDFANALDQSLKKPKAPKGGFCHGKADGTYIFEPVRQVNVHNASADRNQKVHGKSQVYRYDVLAKGQDFVGVILSEDEEALKEMQALLGESLFLGGSHTGGYGRVSVARPTVAPQWNEFIPDSGNPTDGAFILTLLSDAILPAQGLSVEEAMIKAIGLSQDQAVLAGSYFQVRLASGYNRKWGTALAQDWALEAGSVFVVKAASIPDKDTLITQGIGNRRAEGFGRLAINWHMRPTRQRTPIEPAAESSQSVLLRPASRKMAGDMAKRLLRAHLDQQLVALVIGETLPSHDLPSASQLNRVRVAARQALFVKDASPIAAHMDGLKSAKKTWERSNLDEWVRTHSPMPELEFRKAFQLENNLPPVADVTSGLDSDIINEYSARFVDGMMKRAAELARAERDGGQ